ncbi:nitroreductase/quinone reductase family protein [Streptomyces sp. NPDC046685]|uniref:nitroreductase/quinone reductase family protein n=1 Tax=Streptomyces sp. NPDC046685 TaxID=3157202 RepID=UPI00340E884D
MSSSHQSVIEEFRANAGKVGGPYEGSELILLSTTGADSPEPHTVPLGVLAEKGEDGQLFVVASAPGADGHPAWYRNLLARPLVQVETGTDRYEAVAVPVEGPRRDELLDGEPAVGAGAGEAIAVVALHRSHEPVTDEPGLAGRLLNIHGWLRTELALVRQLAAEEEARGKPITSLGLQLRQHCLAFCHSLESHHHGENGGLFPLLEEKAPQMREFIERMLVEHEVIARLEAELAAALDEPGEGFSERVDRMSRELEAHLDGEEEELLPVLRALGV